MSKPRSVRMPDFISRRTPFHYATALNTLSKLGIDINKVDLLAVGEFENYKGEIREQDPAPGEEIHSSTKVTLKVGFPSAVDQMPYQFFYGMHGLTDSTGSWEDAARSLMAPFDASVIRYDSTAKLRELKSGLGLAEYDHLKRFLTLFDFSLSDETNDLNESVIWASVFPTFNEWSGSPSMVCQVFQALFGYQFRIRENTPVEHSIPRSCQSRLGARGDRLGRGLILGRSFLDYDSGFELIISGVPQEHVAEMLPDGNKRKKIERILSTFMPNNLEYKIRVVARGPKAVIGKKEHRNYLGYTSYLGT